MAEEKKAVMTYEEVKFWIEEAKSCEERQRKEFLERNSYPLMLEYYEGSMWPDESSRSSVNARKLSFINEYFPNVNALIAEIMYQNPDILLDAKKPDAEENLPIMKSALTYAFDKLDAITENRLALFDMIMAGFCAVEVNHINTPDVETIPRPGLEEKVSIIGKIGQKIKEAMGKQEVEEEITKTMPIVEIAYSTPDETYLRRWNPLHILLDYRAERIKDIRYIIKKIFWSPAEFNARYPEFKDKIQPGNPMPFTLHADAEHSKSVMLYEFQVRQKRNKFVNFIISPTYNLREIDYFERPYPTNGFNVKIGVLHQHGKLYSISMAKINKSIQDDINNYTTFMMEVAERNIPKIAVDKNKVADVEPLKSAKINDIVFTNGMPRTAIQTLEPTQVSVENKQLLELFNKHKEKLWTISAERLGQVGEANFAEEVKVQQAGFISSQTDIQEGLRKLLREEIDALKDIIVKYWDNPMFFKITGGQKPSWYVPQVVPNPIDGTPMVMNALTDILTADYEVDIDITSALKPNKDRRKAELIKFAEWITSPNVVMFLQSQGAIIDIEVIKKVAKEWGWNPDTIIKQLPPPPMAAGMPPGAPTDASGALPVPGAAPMPPAPVGTPQGAPVA